MGNNSSHFLLVVGRRLALIVQQVGLPVGDEAPVLHGTSTKVRDGYLIWTKRENSTEVVVCDVTDSVFACATDAYLLYTDKQQIHR